MVDDLQRVCTFPGNAARIMEACDEINVRDLLPSVSLPTSYFSVMTIGVVPRKRPNIGG